MADAIQIQAPDGSLIEFPAGTSDATITSVMAREFGGPKAPKAAATPEASNPSNPQMTVDGLGNPIALDLSKPDAAPNLSAGEKTMRAIGAVDSGVRAVANGIPFMDRFAAGMGALTGIGGERGDYAGNLAKQRAEDQRLAEAAPIANTAAHLVGGAMLPLGAIGAAAKGGGLLAKTLLGAGTGGAFGAAQGVSDAPDLTNASDAALHAGKGAVVGSVIGGVLPATGKAIGAGYNAIADALIGAEGMSRPAARHLTNALAADTPAAVRSRLDELGPDAMLADAGPAFLGKTQGAVLNSDEARSIGVGALNARNDATNRRIMGDVDRALGPAEDPQTVTNTIRAHRSAVDNANYPAALNAAPDVQTAPILAQLDYMIPRAVGMERRALTSLRGMMMTTERRPLVDAAGHPQYDNLGRPRFEEIPVNQQDAEVLHKVKQELDNVIQYDAPGLGIPAGAVSRQQGALRMMRGQLNEALEQQVPGYANANRQSAALARRGDAVEAGTQYLGSGKTTPSPERFAGEFGQLEPGEQIAFAKGSRGNIDRLLGTKANDLQALKGELQGEGGWNTAKIATVHGQDAADDLMASVERNAKFRDTHNKVVENSQTAQRRAAAENMKPEVPGEMQLITPQTTGIGLLSAGAKKAANWLINGMRADPTAQYGEMARILTSQGSARDRHLDALATSLLSRDTNRAAAPAIGNRAALAAALLENEYLRDRTGTHR
ncbi:hypothetical protein XI02_13890 [Bradyrhizobium sp. CCBAU 21365]|uniref:hypothetical protein n=1 Tax=Bradyrhizobium sp. CCBAU 21365 TaxID=1325083 RepID=UPI00188D0F3D|nr:hypothetical protein [Bradyrhizobium sp. CCBAU 21365]QOZ15949.1 hypothetical protein XI02_13890 [Bradyrhizobium sp. CCBAU 21365]